MLYPRPPFASSTIAFFALTCTTWMACVRGSVAFGAGTSPTWADASGAMAEPEVFKVKQYLDLSPDSKMVVLGGGQTSGMIVGAMLKVYRSSAQNRLLGQDADAGATPLWIDTGMLKVVTVQANVTVAEVVAQGSTLSRAFFPKFPGVMAGDSAVVQRVTLARRQMAMPTITMSYFDLFEDPKSSPTTFEMKADGIDQLKTAAKTFADARISLLMVEGYTDRNGPSAANQVESYQRALTIRQYLINELGFDPKRVVAVGYGEAEPADPTFAPGYIETNRRIVLKAIPLPGR